MLVSLPELDGAWSTLYPSHLCTPVEDTRLLIARVRIADQNVHIYRGQETPLVSLCQKCRPNMCTPVEDMRLLIAQVRTADPEESAGAAPAAKDEALRATPSEVSPLACAAEIASLQVCGQVCGQVCAAEIASPLVCTAEIASLHAGMRAEDT